MTIADRQADADERRRAAFFGTFHKLNAAHLAQMKAPAVAISPEVRSLLLEYRELVNSRSKAAQIDAIVGERVA